MHSHPIYLLIAEQKVDLVQHYNTVKIHIHQFGQTMTIGLIILMVFKYGKYQNQVNMRLKQWEQVVLIQMKGLEQL